MYYAQNGWAFVLQPRTIRQRRARARRGQVSAVATVLGLLLVVTFITTFVLNPLPELMADLELRHVFLVENQVSRLQSTILAEADNPHLRLSLASPVTLGSQASPPFGIGATSTAAFAGGSSRIQTTYQVAEIVPAPPSWNNGSSCLTGGSGHCAGNGHIDTWNVTNANNTTFTLTVNGNSNSMEYNISGNDDTINIGWTGGDTGFVLFNINGSRDNVIYNKGGSDTTHPVAQFFFYGESDTFNFNPSGSHSSHGGMTVQVVFVGEVGESCPGGNLSASDHVGALSSGGSNLAMSVVWWNLVGWVTPIHQQTYPGGGGNNETISWSNQSGFVQCAFTRSYTSTYTTQNLGGVAVTLNNIYLPRVVVALDNGAVVEGQVGGASTMIDPPAISFVRTALGIAASVTLMNFIGNFTAESGVTTAAVVTSLISAHTVNVGGTNASQTLGGTYFLNLTTMFPGAWTAFFAKMTPMVPSGTSCQAIAPIPKPYTCLDPPPATYERLVVPIVAEAITITTLTIAISLD
ncbi:MAG: hypothetical protein L3K23_07980 [Thermoplasmata archaeon]|nr:hypothetical protein [Thermoplasmata archaeon]